MSTITEVLQAIIKTPSIALICIFLGDDTCKAYLSQPLTTKDKLKEEKEPGVQPLQTKKRKGLKPERSMSVELKEGLSKTSIDNKEMHQELESKTKVKRTNCLTRYQLRKYTKAN